MANRFLGLTQYHQIILVHGVFAAITFLLLVPAAIFIARFYHRNGRLALRLHIWIQITVVFLATVVLILGWFAVGPQRSLTNPHHGIGVAVYTLIIFQAIFGWFVRWIEKGKERYKIPLKLYVSFTPCSKHDAEVANPQQLHQWLGRAIALLAIVQVALGLTLYGSPKYLFILYTVWVFVMFFAYFVLSYMNQTRIVGDDRGSYMYSETEITERPQGGRFGGRFGALAAGGLGAVALGGLARRFSGRRRNDSRERVSAADSRSRFSGRQHGSRVASESYVEDEKYTEDGRRKQHTWRDRLLVAGAGVGLFAAARGLFGRKRREEEEETDSYLSGSHYHHPLGGSHSIHETETDIRRVEEGRLPMSPETARIGNDEAGVIPVAHASPSRRAALRDRRDRRSGGGDVESWEEDSEVFDSPSRNRKKDHTLRDGVAAMGVAGFLRHKWNQRKQRQEDNRMEEIRESELQDERFSRMGGAGKRFTGDGAPNRLRRHNSMTESDMTPYTGSTPALSHQRVQRTDVTTTGPSGGLPPPPPIPGAMVHDSSGSEAYTSVASRQHSRHRMAEEAAIAAGTAAAGLAAEEAISSRRRRLSRRRGSDSGTDVNSPPVSVKVKMHNDGRHVTLRRLDPAEAAAEREARRRDRRRNERTGSVSSIGGRDEHWRRVEEREAAEAAALAAGEQSHNIPPIPTHLPGPPLRPPPATATPPRGAYDYPPPPPIPASQSALGGSPGSAAYDSSAVGSRADSNRRRRRAERARVEQAAREARGNRVDFT